jgi:hypothetical protein
MPQVVVVELALRQLVRVEREVLLELQQLVVWVETRGHSRVRLEPQIQEAAVVEAGRLRLAGLEPAAMEVLAL